MLTSLCSQFFNKNNLRQYTIKQNILAFIRVFISFLLLSYDILFQTYIAPLIFIPYISRYIASLTNYVILRLVLYIYGIVTLQSEKLQYFTKKKNSNFYRNNSNKLRFNSGWIGVSSRTNFLDFLYLSCTFNPTFVRMVQINSQQYKKNNTVYKKMLYIPLTFKQSLYASLDYHGFDPIVVNTQQQLRKLKVKKLQIKNIIRQNQQQFLGPVLVFLPQISPQKQVVMNQILHESMNQNHGLFSRYGMAYHTLLKPKRNNLLVIQKQQQKQMHNLIKISYKNQIDFLLELCSKLKRYKLLINSQIVTHNLYDDYNINIVRQLHTCNQIDKFYNKMGYKIFNISYTQYLKQQCKMKQLYKIDKQNKKNKDKYDNYPRKDIKKSQQKQQESIKLKFNNKKFARSHRPIQSTYNKLNKTINKIKFY